MSVLLLQLVNGLEVPIQVLAAVIPRILRIVDFLIGPRVREEDFSSVGLQIGERVENMPSSLSASSDARRSRCSHT